MQDIQQQAQPVSEPISQPIAPTTKRKGLVMVAFVFLIMVLVVGGAVWALFLRDKNKDENKNTQPESSTTQDVNDSVPDDKDSEEDKKPESCYPNCTFADINNALADLKKQANYVVNNDSGLDNIVKETFKYNAGNSWYTEVKSQNSDILESGFDLIEVSGAVYSKKSGGNWVKGFPSFTSREIDESDLNSYKQKFLLNNFLKTTNYNGTKRKVEGKWVQDALTAANNVKTSTGKASIMISRLSGTHEECLIKDDTQRFSKIVELRKNNEVLCYDEVYYFDENLKLFRYDNLSSENTIKRTYTYGNAGKIEAPL